MSAELAADAVKCAMRELVVAVRVLRERHHAGHCLACDGSGEVWAWEAKANARKCLGTCPACNGHGVQDCGVDNCEQCR
jgi:DnaJ-class molecular chaperone